MKSTGEVLKQAEQAIQVLKEDLKVQTQRLIVHKIQGRDGHDVLSAIDERTDQIALLIRSHDSLMYVEEIIAGAE